MQEILKIVNDVAVFYLLEELVFHLLPEKSYGKYVRFYMGLLLVLLLLQPIFQIFDLTQQMDANALIYELEQEVEDLK